MNKDSHHPPIEPELEARIVALVLGEASDFEREELERLIQQRPELADFQAEMQYVHGLLGEVGKGEAEPTDDNWKLPANGRNKVLATINGEPTEPPAVNLSGNSKRHARFLGGRFKTTTKVAAAVLAACFIGFMMLPTLSSSREGQVATSKVASPSDEWMGDFDRDFADEMEEDFFSADAPATKAMPITGGTVLHSSVDAPSAPEDFAETDSKKPQSSLSDIRDSLAKNDLPSPHYLQDDVQYFPSGPEFKLPREMAESRARSAGVPDNTVRSVPARNPRSAPRVLEDLSLQLPELRQGQSSQGQAEGLSRRASGDQSGSVRGKAEAVTSAQKSPQMGHSFQLDLIDGADFGTQPDGSAPSSQPSQPQSSSGQEQPSSSRPTIGFDGIGGLPSETDKKFNSSALGVVPPANESNGQRSSVVVPDSGTVLLGGIKRQFDDQEADKSTLFDVYSDTKSMDRFGGGMGGGGGGIAGGAEETDDKDGSDKIAENQAKYNNWAAQTNRAWMDGLPAPKMPAIPKTVDSDGNSSINESEEEAQIQFVPELGQVIVKGNTKDVERVKSIVSELERKTATIEQKKLHSVNASSDGQDQSEPKMLKQLKLSEKEARTSKESELESRVASKLAKKPASGITSYRAEADYKSKADKIKRLHAQSLDAVTRGASELHSQNNKRSTRTAGQPTKADDWYTTSEARDGRQSPTSNLKGIGLRHDPSPVDSLYGKFFEEPKTRGLKSQKTTVPAGLNEKLAADESFSTFSLHVSDVSFKLARAALARGEWPEAAKIRIEEFVNAFDYGDPMPCNDEKVACQVEQAAHPFLQQRNVLRVSMRTAAAGRASNTPLRLTFLLDNSGSMERIDRRQTVRRAFALLAQQLTPIDQVTLISFARQPRLLADKVSGAKAAQLVQLIDSLPSEGGTNIESALQLAFEKAREHQVDNAQNRIILLTDGAVNLGDANPEHLSQMVTTMRNAGIAFDAAGISAEGLNDEVLEALTRKGDGRYYLLDSLESANDGFARQIAGALRPSAKNVKVQVEFNPKRVGRYKLLGFEKHRLKKEDFRNDKVDAAEMAAAEAGVAVYQFEAKPNGEGDVGFVSVRFRDLSTGKMIENRWPIPYEAEASRLDLATPSLRIATSAALLAAKLKSDPLGESVDLKKLNNIVAGLPEQSRQAKRIQQLQQMIQQARQVSGK